MTADESEHKPPETGWAAEPVDPDTADVAWPHTAARSQRWEHARLLAVIGAGGLGGAAARYGAGLTWPAPAGGFPWSTFWINVIGCGLMGILMVMITERITAHPLLRPFLGTGVLGGFTTFSTYTIDTAKLLEPRTSNTALLYMAGTLLVAVVAVWLGATLTRLITVPMARRRL